MGFLSIEVYVRVLSAFAEFVEATLEKTSNTQVLESFSMAGWDGFPIVVMDRMPDVYEAQEDKLLLFYCESGNIPKKHRVTRPVPWLSPRGFQPLRGAAKSHIQSSYRRRQDLQYAYRTYRMAVSRADHLPSSATPRVFLVHVANTAAAGGALPKSRSKTTPTTTTECKPKLSQLKPKLKVKVKVEVPELPPARPPALASRCPTPEPGRDFDPFAAAPVPGPTDLSLSHLNHVVNGIIDPPSASSLSVELPVAPPPVADPFLDLLQNTAAHPLAFVPMESDPHMRDLFMFPGIEPGPALSSASDPAPPKRPAPLFPTLNRSTLPKEAFHALESPLFDTKSFTPAYPPGMPLPSPLNMGFAPVAFPH